MLKRSANPLILLFIICLCVTASAQVGDVTGVHDPSIIQSGDTFYLFSTGRGLTERVSKDLFTWKRVGRVFPQSPEWTHDYNPFGGGWAPDISFVNGEYRLYYAVSTFGRTFSAIGLSVNATLDPNSREYRWIDRGRIIASPAKSDWNAIDPCAFLDEQGNAWMVLGSCWTGLKLVELNPKTGLLADARRQPTALAAFPPENVIEEGYIRHHGEFYYLWESVDRCCRGVESTYRILIGRSKEVQGPYLDRDGKPMLRGGGTLMIASYGNTFGPGSCAVVHASDNDYLVHHEYDGENRGIPTLQIREVFWASDGWPVVGEPITRPPGEKPAAIEPPYGDWLERVDFGDERPITLNKDGSLAPSRGSWRLGDGQLLLTLSGAAKDRTINCNIAEDGSYFVGRDENGAVVTAVRGGVADQK